VHAHCLPGLGWLTSSPSSHSNHTARIMCRAQLVACVICDMATELVPGQRIEHSWREKWGRAGTSHVMQPLDQSIAHLPRGGPLIS
jgi:hypothetical protein